MRWQGGRRSSNVEDIRGQGGRMGLGGGGLKVGGGMGLVLVVVALLLGVDPRVILQGGGSGPAPAPPSSSQRGGSAPTDETSEFVSVVLAMTEDTWKEIFAQSGERYEEPRLVLFSDMVESACGMSSAATGPFYCPGDRKVYLDLNFLGELKRIGVSGDFAVAYVIAHEVGHHVQTLLGTSQRVNAARQQGDETEANALSVRLELQADCYAGVWAYHTNRRSKILEAGDVEEALAAAAAIGDDRLQKMSGRAVNPESFTHGSSEQRVRWFRTGLERGSVQACDTFGGR